jgi:hypothetical protein
MLNQQPSFDAPARVANEKKAALGYVLPKNEFARTELEPEGLPFVAFATSLQGYHWSRSKCIAEHEATHQSHCEDDGINHRLAH